jgi:hypothetical protein
MSRTFDYPAYRDDRPADHAGDGFYCSGPHVPTGPQSSRGCCAFTATAHPRPIPTCNAA